VPKILVADDNANIQKMVSLSFEDRGVQVVAVGNGEAAVRRIPDLNPDLVLADIFMPVRNGYEVCEFVKKDERFSHVPVILLVGAFDPLDEKEARRVGADGVLKKPFVPPDPLIAMVMSALEKNPKIAAELAKMREAKQAPPPPPVEEIPEPATSVRAEIKPLPEFPEPSAEEAALIYGFGTGKRAIDDAPIDTSSEPKPPAGEVQEADEEEFDSSSTRRDWRRNAMEIEIPPETANQPAFSQFETAMFPSEQDVPPKRVAVPEASEEKQAVAKSEMPAPVQHQEPDIQVPQDAASSADSNFFAPAESKSGFDKSPEPFFAGEPARSAPEPELSAAKPPESEESVEAPPSHWMDRLAQGSEVHAPTDWMSALHEQTARQESIAAPNPATDSPASVAQPEIFDERRQFHSEAAAPEIAAPESESDFQPLARVAPAPTTDELAGPHHPTSGETFFADDAETAPSVMNESWLSARGRASEQHAPERMEEALEATSENAVPLVATSAAEGLETDSSAEPPFAFKDPDLVQPPAVHVTPEPLLMEDEPQSESQYGLPAKQDLQPLHSFFVPESEAPEPATPVTAASEAAFAEAPSAIFGPEPVPVNGLIPTAPPPNREALAEIPFLTPPPDFHAPVHEQASPSPETVDAVVRKVLEKLEPQLHDLLSQGVLKPLVENLLQGEFAKKEK